MHHTHTHRHAYLEHSFSVQIPDANAILRGVFDRVDIIGQQQGAQHDYFNNSTIENRALSSSEQPQHVWVTDFKSNVRTKKPELMVRSVCCVLMYQELL